MCLSDDATIRSKGEVISLPPKTAQQIKIYDDSPLMKGLLYTTLGLIVGAATSALSIVFPYVPTPIASKEVYQAAWYNYDPALSFFDNTAWTYATDYGLTVIMLSLVASIALSTSGNAAVGLQRRTIGLLLCYAVSVGAGAVAHQTFLTLESRNTLEFRLLWTLCVGSVTLAGGFMGACGSQVATMTMTMSNNNNNNANKSNYVIPEWFWAGFGSFTTAFCCAGYMSMQRPACDIFIAGITQFPSTVYICLVALFGQSTNKSQVLSPTARYACCFGFLFNAPLLPMYALVLHHTDWSLPRINFTLHCWLCVAWTTQGLALRHFAEAANRNNKVIIKANKVA